MNDAPHARALTEKALTEGAISACRTLRQWEMDALGVAAWAPPSPQMLMGAEITAAWIRARCAICGLCPDLIEETDGLMRPRGHG